MISQKRSAIPFLAKWVARLLVSLLMIPTSPTLADKTTQLASYQQRGVVRSRAVATLMADLTAQVAYLPFQAGDSFRAGDVLLRFDCRHIEIAIAGAKAELAAREVTYRANLKLKQHDAVGNNDLLISKAQADKARAELAALQLRLQKCTIIAPFDGRVAERLIEEHETPAANSPLLKILKDSELEIDVILPSKALAWLRKGMRFQFHVDETGERLDAELIRIGAAVDPVSQTIKVSGRFLTPSKRVLHGMSGTAIWQLQTSPQNQGF